MIALVVARRHTITVEQLRSFQGPPAPTPADVKGVSFAPDSLAGLDVEIAEPDTGGTIGDVLYFHGGGYIAGTPSTQRRLVGALALAAGVRVWSVDYRLAPEHPAPAAVEDGLASYRAMVERVDPSQLILAGESAGGGLAASTLLAVREAGLPVPRAVVLLAPLVDLTLSGGSFADNVGKDMLTPEFTAMCRDAYVGDHDPADPRISTLYADLSALPPTYLQVGDFDLIRDDAVRYAKAAEAAGSPTTLRVWPKVGHGFVGTGDDLPESREAIGEIANWLRQQF